MGEVGSPPIVDNFWDPAKLLFKPFLAMSLMETSSEPLTCADDLFFYLVNPII
eukprot:CAMPEP_0170504286 /NCGR_PEP_ID=MMETSP0208-20121228/47465_1 /TAXON_ID=197538 /ORGANISM="Strombidium inclinatum, Strain S3" /LENGTH=52 /DNA_ID=CAMNT_0010784461 /DNA_START=263 /DNA_END=421 /DNA_ORIENTATION=-